MNWARIGFRIKEFGPGAGNELGTLPHWRHPWGRAHAARYGVYWIPQYRLWAAAGSEMGTHWIPHCRVWAGGRQ
eukprot:12067752-Prorocentrum_lima.AAC.1